MFHDLLTPAMQARMAYLEAQDARDRDDGTPHAQRLRQIPPETGRLLALLARSAPAGHVVEVGTSGGYSSLWLALGCQARHQHLTTLEIDPHKVQLARETFAAAGVADWIEVVPGDALLALPNYMPIGLCFVDLEKQIYPPAYELVVPRLAPGGFFVADNVISHADELASFLEHAHNDPRLDTVVVPIGKGLLLGCRTSTA